MTRLELLRATKALIENPARWTQGCNARDGSGSAAPVTSKRAVCWCVAGALEKVGGDDGLYVEGDGSPFDLLRMAAQSDPHLRLLAERGRGKLTPPPAAVNDYGTHADVMRMLDIAIAHAEAAELIAADKDAAVKGQST